MIKKKGSGRAYALEGVAARVRCCSRKEMRKNNATSDGGERARRGERLNVSVFGSSKFV